MSKVRRSVQALFQASCALAVLATTAPVYAQPRLEFRELPNEIREHAIEVRGRCNQEKAFNEMQGITILDLKGDGSRDIVIDNKGFCGSHMAGFNCSNRGCDMQVYKEITRGQWRKNFEEHLHSRYLAIDWETMRLQLMVVSIYAGDPRCQPIPKRDYTSGKSEVVPVI